MKIRDMQVGDAGWIVPPGEGRPFDPDADASRLRDEARTLRVVKLEGGPVADTTDSDDPKPLAPAEKAAPRTKPKGE